MMREAILISEATGNQIWVVDPIPLEVNEQGEAIDSGPMDAAIEACYEEEGIDVAYAVWADTGEWVVCES